MNYGYDEKGGEVKYLNNAIEESLAVILSSTSTII